METQELIQAKKDGFEQFKSLSIEEHFKRQYDMKCLIDKLEEENKLLKDENQKAIEQMLEFTERYSELEHRLNKFLDEDEKRKAEEREKAERRLKRKEYDRRTDKKVYAVEPFLNKEDFELFMKKLKEKYYEVYILGVVLFSNALRYSDGIKLKFKAIKKLVETLDLNENVALPTTDQKTTNNNTISFPEESHRRTLKEYFMKVEKTGIRIDDNTPLMINLRLKKPLKKKMLNEYLMRILSELHEEKKLLHTVRVGTHSFRKTWTRLALLNKKIRPDDVRRKLRHSTLEQTYMYDHFSIEEINGFLKLNVNI